MCAVLGVTPSGYYAWRGRPLITPQVRANAGLRARIRAIHAESRGRYGSPRVHAALRAEGEQLGRNRVIRLMRAEQLRGRPRRRFRVPTTQADPAATPAPNRLNQVFQATAPNRVWTGDITAMPTGEGWLYLAVLLDLYSRRVVGWAVRPTLETELVCAAWHMASARRRPAAGLIHHSDRGCQYQCPVSSVAADARRQLQHEPTGQLLRQCADRKLLPYLESRDRCRVLLADSTRGDRRHRRLHRRLLQHTAAAFEPQLSESGGVRTALRGCVSDQWNDLSHAVQTTTATEQAPQMQGPRRWPMA
jgi:putative transposase